ncbi:MAG: methyltransferase domain-containing protein [Gaiellaceae bacterium]
MAYPIPHRHAGSKCLGAYECELHQTIEQIISRGYGTILNVGCGEGYYAVGLARRMPSSTIVAVDYNPAALTLCRRLAIANRIEEGRIRYRLEATHELLEEVAGPETLILADVEGFEFRLLDPTAAPSLLRSDILVELHEHVCPGIETVLRARFSASHGIRSIPSEPRRDATVYPELRGMSSHSRLLALAERPFPMTWLMLTRELA